MKRTSLIAEVHPARADGARDFPALQTALAALALDTRSPLALELAATATSRHFLLRAQQESALQHLAGQVQARYPQAAITPVSVDPLTLAPGEACSALELRPGAASALPLRSWKAREWLAEGVDPLLGILAAFSALPPGARAVSQLALLPASPTWSASSRREVQEQARVQARAKIGSEKSLQDVLWLLPVVAVLLLLFAFPGILPRWLWQAAQRAMRGQSPHLSAGEMLALAAGGAILLVLLFGGIWLGTLLMRRFGTPRLQDQRLVEEKTALPAYRVRLRLFVMAPDFLLVTPSASPGTWLRLWQRRLCRRGKRLRAVLAGRASLGGAPAPAGPISWRARGRILWHLLLTWGRAAWRCFEARRHRRRTRMDLLRTLAASYRQFHLAAGGYFCPHPLSSRRVRILLASHTRRWLRRRGWTSGLWRSAHYLSVADLAALWHVPQAQDLPDLAYVAYRTMRTLPAPALLATLPGYRLGSSTHAGQTLPVVLPFACLLQNVLACASTGKGKSSLFSHLMHAFALGRQHKRTDVPEGALLIDPHGDLKDLVAGSLPPELADDVLVIDLADQDAMVAFNPLDMSGAGKDRDKSIDNLILVVESLWPTSYGPRTESILEYSCKTLAEANLTLISADPLSGPDRQYTLLDVVALLRQTSFRHTVLEQVHDPRLLAWWHQYYDLLDGRQQADFTSSLITKIAKFSSTKLISRILGQPRSSLDLSEIIEQNKIVLFSCGAGVIGADMAALFGSLFVGFFQAALQEQARLRPSERHRFLVLIDEFQALAGINYQTLLAEMRKYGGSFALATQSLAYLDRFERTLRATVLANTEHLFAFAMADEDARLLRLPGVMPEDVTLLPNYACYVRLTLRGARLPVFSLHLDAPPPGDPAWQHELTTRSRARYGRTVGEVERILQECQARRDMAGWNMGAGGSAGPWAGSGVESAAEVIERIRTRRRGSGTAKKGGKDEAGTERTAGAPEHLMYEGLSWRESDEAAGEGS